MTQTELDKLTPHEKRLAIADACGWTRIQSEPWTNGLGRMNYTWYGHDPENKNDNINDLLPDYLNSLDAMHEAEKKILRTDGDTYRQHLLSERGTEWGYATAEQRADAFLLTMG